MLIPIKILVEKYAPKFTGVIHGGAHFGEEYEYYLSAGITEQIWIEPCQSSFDILRHKIGATKGVLLFNCACGASRSTAKMFVAPSNQGQSNSLLAPDKHLEQHPSVQFTEIEEVVVIRLDYLPFNREKYNFLSLDVQGYEGEVLKGAVETMPYIDYVYLEVNRDSTYRGNMLIEEIDELLHEFERVETQWSSATSSWGDAFWIRKTKMK